MELYFDRCKSSDFGAFYQLKRDEENILWTGHQQYPSKNTLKVWFLNQLSRVDRLIFIVKSKEEMPLTLGYFYLDFKGVHNESVEISLGVHSDYKGRGIGTQIIKYAIHYITCNALQVQKVEAWVADENLGSIKTFVRNGFNKTVENKSVFFEGFNKEMIMYQYILDINRES